MSRVRLKAPFSQAEVAAAQSPSPRFMKFTRQRRVVKRNQQKSFVWLISPGMFEWGRSADWDLTDNAKARKVSMDDGTVKRICVGQFEGDDHIYIWATDDNDSDAFRIDRNGKKMRANASDFFFTNGIVRPPGVKEKFDLLPADVAIEGGPALCFHLNKPIAKGTFETSKKKKVSNETKAAETKAAENKAAENKQQ